MRPATTRSGPPASASAMLPSGAVSAMSTSPSRSAFVTPWVVPMIRSVARSPRRSRNPRCCATHSGTLT